MAGPATGGLGAWLERFAAALRSGEAEAVADLFQPGGLWRDLISFGWTIATHEGRDEIRAFVDRLGPQLIERARVDGDRDIANGFVMFDAPNGTVNGYARIKDGKAVTLLTALRDLRNHPEAIDRHRPAGVEADRENWSERRARENAEIGRQVQPYVLIVGGGQAGLALGARLKALDVPTLIIDRHPRVGDQWRSRYKSLTLHDPVWYDHLPYMPFPANWPIYTPKDKMGQWLELYASAMELDIWTRASLRHANYDAAAGRWIATIERGGETMRVECAELVLALGNAGFPIVPEVPGAEGFAGRQYHSSLHPGGAGLVGRDVAIVGANNSAHDIAADLVQHGARPTLVQRSSTLVARQETLFDQSFSALYSEEALDAGMTTERADIAALSVPMRMAERIYPPVWVAIEEADREFYESLRGVGFSLDFAEDGAGLALKYLRSASGYYIDVGASQMVIDGRIAVKSGSEIDRIDEAGLVFADGSRLDADVIVYATGFGAMEEWVAALIGPDVAAKIGRCWGYGSGFKGDPGPWEGELRNMWKPTAQQGLWFMGGNLQQCRTFSRYLAQQLKARQVGLPVDVIEPARNRGLLVEA